MALPTLAPDETTDSEPTGRQQPKREHIMLAAVAVVVLLAGGWFFFLRSSGSSTPPPPVPHKAIVRTGAAGGAKAGAVAGAKATAGAKTATAAGAKPTAAPGAKAAAAATATAPATQSELAAYVAKANALCADTNTKLKAIDTSDTTIKGRIAVWDQSLPLQDSEVSRLTTLAVPANHPEFRKLYGQQKEIVTLGHQIRAALFDGNPNTVLQLTAWQLQDAKTVATAYTAAGLTSCAGA